MNSDGLIDVLSTSKWDDKVAWYENEGDLAFGEQNIIAFNTGVDEAVSAISADINNDGYKDIVSISQVSVLPLYTSSALMKALPDSSRRMVCNFC